MRRRWNISLIFIRSSFVAATSFQNGLTSQSIHVNFFVNACHNELVNVCVCHIIQSADRVRGRMCEAKWKSVEIILKKLKDSRQSCRSHFNSVWEYLFVSAACICAWVTGPSGVARTSQRHISELIRRRRVVERCRAFSLCSNQFAAERSEAQVKIDGKNESKDNHCWHGIVMRRVHWVWRMLEDETRAGGTKRAYFQIYDSKVRDDRIRPPEMANCMHESANNFEWINTWLWPVARAARGVSETPCRHCCDIRNVSNEFSSFSFYWSFDNTRKGKG